MICSFGKPKIFFVAHFVTVLGLSGTEPTILLRYACIVLVIYCCVMDYQKLNGIKQEALTNLTFSGSRKSGPNLPGSSDWGSLADNKVVIRCKPFLWSHLKAQLKEVWLLKALQDSLPWNYWSEASFRSCPIGLSFGKLTIWQPACHRARL